MQGNKVTAHVAAVVVFAAILACMPGMASAAFSSSTRASLTNTVAELGAPVPGPPATQTCTPQGSGPTRSFINVITVKPFSAAAGATGYELRVLKPGGQLAGSSTGTAAAGGSVTVTLTGADPASGWTYVIRANRMFSATNTWTKDSAADTAPVSNTNGTCK